MVFGLVAMASVDLSVDLLHVSTATMPRWLKNLSSPMIARHAFEAQTMGTWIRRTFDCFLLAVGSAVPVLIWRPGESSDLGTKAIWAIFVFVCLGWFVRLYRMPRD